MDRLKKILIEAKNENSDTVTDRIEVIGLSIASCLNRAVSYWDTDLMSLDYEILEKGKSSFLHKKPYRMEVKFLPEDDRLTELEEFSEKLGVGSRLINKSLESYIAPKNRVGRAIVRNYFDGVYLTVFPPLGTGQAVSKDAVLRQISLAGANKYNEKITESAIQSASEKKVRIADFEHISDNDSTCKIEISSDRMKAFATVSPPKRNGRHLNVGDIVALLKANKVLVGFKESEVDQILQKDTYGKPFIAAEGTYSKHGEDSRVDYKVNVKKNIVKLQEDVLGRVDFKDLNMIENVVVGQILAEKIPAQMGKKGLTIFNEVVETKDGKDLPLKPGKGTILSMDEMKLTAEINGQVSLSRGTICVEPVYRIARNIGPKTGNVNFLGSVYVGGAVLSGFEVKASGNIEIMGGVQKAVIEAEGDIIVRSGVLGSNLTSTAGNVVIKYIQDSKIYAPKDVLVAEGVLRSEVDTGGSLFCNGRRAQIVGGHIRVKNSLRARVIGSSAYTATEITAGTDPDILSQYAVTLEELSKTGEESNTITKFIRSYEARKRASPKSFTKEQEEILTEKKQALVEHKKNTEELQKTRINLEKHFMHNRCESKIHAERYIYPGTVINILKAKHNVPDTHTAVTLSYEDGYIKVNKLEKKKSDMPSYQKWKKK